MWVIVTGASSGVGLATAQRLARSGRSDLLLVSRSQDKLALIAEEIRIKNRKNVETLNLDLSRSESQSAIASWIGQKSQVRGLVNSAGIGGFGQFVDLNVDDLRKVLSINLEATFLTTQTFVRSTQADGNIRTVVNVASDADSVAFNEASLYCASKFGVRGLSGVLQQELISQNIRVCNLSPGRIDTFFNNKKPGMRQGALSADQVAEVIEFVIYCNSNLQIKQIDVDSMSRTS